MKSAEKTNKDWLKEASPVFYFSSPINHLSPFLSPSHSSSVSSCEPFSLVSSNSPLHGHFYTRLSQNVNRKKGA
ncbi:hypothetical protein BPUM_0620 [Bacillus pumilus SAFR-032]|uniref:Uncharacterized protein n=1 Tax=Bacillus pumilus (strain SAFR-032) TaxID=315750 RepID=A8FAP5_BACP2|nr:hypothetical protein BPUM_0620 [Bacillus pumilus SAFR-032]